VDDDARSAASTEAWWLEPARCAELAGAVSSSALLATCDAGCIESGCEHATRDLVDAISSGIAAIEPSRRKVVLTGDLEITYSDTLQITSIDGPDLEGAWSGPDEPGEGDAVTATLTVVPTTP
jgi:hypothetical protein